MVIVNLHVEDERMREERREKKKRQPQSSCGREKKVKETIRTSSAVYYEEVIMMCLLEWERMSHLAVWDRIWRNQGVLVLGFLLSEFHCFWCDVGMTVIWVNPTFRVSFNLGNLVGIAGYAWAFSFIVMVTGSFNDYILLTGSLADCCLWSSIEVVRGCGVGRGEGLYSLLCGFWDWKYRVLNSWSSSSNILLLFEDGMAAWVFLLLYKAFSIQECGMVACLQQPFVLFRLMWWHEDELEVRFLEVRF
ncbi:hypothetical protein Tco_0087551 [Tanacetum coccineum]